MNIVFWLLVILGATCLWFCLSFLFTPLGKSFHRLYQDAMDEINKNDETDESNEQ